MTFSAVTSTLNAEETLQRCLASVAEQTVQVQHLVIDGASIDGTLDILRESRAEWISEPDRGIYDSWNKAIARATGDYVFFLGADDAMNGPHALEAVADRLHGDLPLLPYAPVVVVDEADRPQFEVGRPWEEIRSRFLKGPSVRQWCHQGLLIRRDAFQTYGLFDQAYRVAGDYEWLLRVVRRTPPVHLEVPPMVRFRAGGASQGARNARVALAEMVRAQRQHNLPKITPHLLRCWAGVYGRQLLRAFGTRRP